MKLQLTVPQLESLLTEEMKVELAAGVLANFSERIKERAVAKLNNLHNTAISNAIDRALVDGKIIISNWGKVELSQEVKNKITAEIKVRFDRDMELAINEEYARQLPELQKLVDARITRLVNAHDLRGRINTILDSEITTAVREKLAKLNIGDLLK